MPDTSELKAKLRRIDKPGFVRQPIGPEALAAIERLEAENASMREALDKITNLIVSNNGFGMKPAAGAVYMQNIARKALEGLSDDH